MRDKIASPAIPTIVIAGLDPAIHGTTGLHLAAGARDAGRMLTNL
jgi:hypothetical protein